jgi:hypothetical protein
MCSVKERGIDRAVIGTWKTDLQRRKATGFENNRSNGITKTKLNGAEPSFRTP